VKTLYSVWNNTPDNDSIIAAGLTVDECAKLLGIKKNTVYEQVSRRKHGKNCSILIISEMVKDDEEEDNMVVIKPGNILDAKENLIFQQVNCQNVMGSGLAKAIYTKWPVVKEKYHKFCDGKKPEDLLGHFQTVQVTDNQYVVNIFGQLSYGRERIHYTDYNALDKAFKAISRTRGSIAVPYGMGAGLANGDWSTVLLLIKKHFYDHNVTIYKL